ncbi:MAG: hypothetical protein QGF00_20050 [Planctomycetota bacterium]|jgi:hypothetical protein|nr:hypothetical protein [Planctomycetota bacterium]MDP7251913.1 hypothetical protein [Planctomycetota bacterium]
MEIEYDPRLLESVVFLELRRRELAGDTDPARLYRERIDPLYELSPEDPNRESGFRDIHAESFRLLGMEQLVLDFLSEFPLVEEHVDRIVILKAPSRKEEGADMFVREDEGVGDHQRSTVLRLRAETFHEPERLSSLLRRELFHMSDMVDPAFGYGPDLSEGVETLAHENLIRDRYRVLWDTYIDGRLSRKGNLTNGNEETREELFRRAFSCLETPEADRIRRMFWESEHLTHGDLLAVAEHHED